jgi:hypothetical protein
MSGVVSNNPKATITALATGLESLAALIKDETLQRVCVIIAPAVALALTFLLKFIIRSFESQKGLKTYAIMISEYEKQLGNPNITAEKKAFLELEIEKCQVNINKIRTDNIRITNTDF